MTAKTPAPNSRDACLEEILETVRSIDHTVEEILDKLTDQFDALRDQNDWQGAPQEPPYFEDDLY